MKDRFNEIGQRLQMALDENAGGYESLRRISKNRVCIMMAIKEAAQSFPLHYSGYSESEQIEINKDCLPPLYAKLILNRLQYQLENIRIHGTEQKFQEYCDAELLRIQQFYIQHRRFCEDYLSGSTENDWIQFTTISDDEHQLPDAEYLFDLNTHPNTLLLATLLAYEEYTMKLKGHEVSDGTFAMPVGQLTFDGPVIQLIELMLSLWVSERFKLNGEPVSQKFFEDAVKKILGITIPNLSGRIVELKDRKKGSIVFLYDLIRDLENYLRLLPEDQPRKKAG